MNLNKATSKEMFCENAKEFIINSNKTLHKKCGCRYSQFVENYYDFDTMEEVQASNINFTQCKLCFPSKDSQEQSEPFEQSTETQNPENIEENTPPVSEQNIPTDTSVTNDDKGPQKPKKSIIVLQIIKDVLITALIVSGVTYGIVSLSNLSSKKQDSAHKEIIGKTFTGSLDTYDGDYYIEVTFLDEDSCGYTQVIKDGFTTTTTESEEWTYKTDGGLFGTRISWLTVGGIDGPKKPFIIKTDSDGKVTLNTDNFVSNYSLTLTVK